MHFLHWYLLCFSQGVTLDSFIPKVVFADMGFCVWDVEILSPKENSFFFLFVENTAYFEL